MKSTALFALVLALLISPAVASAAKPAWQLAPVVPEPGLKVERKILKTIKAGRARGMRAAVFAKAGDSNTEMSSILYGLGCANPVYGSSSGLAKVVAKYRRQILPNPWAFAGCVAGNSFSRRSAAARSSTWVAWASSRIDSLNPLRQPGPPCTGAETPITCEIRLVKPRYMVIMTGTNDVGLDLLSGVLAGSQIGERLGPSITQIRSRGVVPVLSTIPPIHSDDPARQAALADGVARTNAGIFRLARERNLPLINLWRALTGPAMIDQGISTDQLHLSIFGGELPSLLPGPATFAASVNFTDPALRYGANRRNLIWLKTLARLDRITG